MTTNQIERLISDESPVELPKGLVWVEWETSTMLLQRVLEQAGLNRKSVFPCDTNTMMILVRCCGYRLTRIYFQKTIADRINLTPSKHRNEFSWQERNVIDWLEYLEDRRMWAWGHPAHVHKLSPKEKAKHDAEVLQRRALYETFLAMPLPELLSLVTQCSKREVREVLVCCIKEQLGILHLKGNEQPDNNPANSN